MNKKYFKAFTLVELIIVITILAILATIAFVSFNNYTKSARDANRVSTLTNLQKGLDIYSVQVGRLPVPENPQTFTGGLNGKSLINQGILTQEVLQTLSSTPVDPVTGKQYTYSTFGNGKYYQIAGNLETELSQNLGNQTYANTFQTAKLIGNYRYDPSLPSLIIGSGTTLFSPETCFVVDGGSNTLENCIITKENLPGNTSDSSLVGYWDMETLTGTLLKDLSGNGNHGVLNGAMVIGGTGGFLGNSIVFDGTNDVIEIFDNETIREFDNGITIGIAFQTNSINSGVSILSKYGTGDTNSLRDTNYDIMFRSGAKEMTTNLTNRKSNIVNLNDCGDANPRILGKYGCWIWPRTDFIYDNSDFLYYYFTYNSSDLTGKIYLNGAEISQQTFLNKEELNENERKVRNAMGNLYLGKKYNSSSFFDGIIDEVKIYNRALTDEEIMQQARIAGF